jgi:L,D-transpeptidase YcbB
MAGSSVPRPARTSWLRSTALGSALSTVALLGLPVGAFAQATAETPATLDAAVELPPLAELMGAGPSLETTPAALAPVVPVVAAETTVDVPALATLAGDGPAFDAPAVDTAAAEPAALPELPELAVLNGDAPAFEPAAAPMTETAAITAPAVEVTLPDLAVLNGEAPAFEVVPAPVVPAPVIAAPAVEAELPALAALEGDGPALPDAQPTITAAIAPAVETAPTVTPAPEVTTTAALPAPVAAAPAGPSNTEVSEAIARLVSAAPAPQGARSLRADRDGVLTFFAERGHQPVFTSGGELTSAAKTLAATLGEAHFDGLDSATYRVAAPEATADALARFELDFAEALVRYARHASQGRVDPASISANITVDRHEPVAIETLRALSAASDPKAALLAFHPQHEGYKRLRARLAEALAAQPAVEAPREQSRFPDGPMIRPGTRDARVALLRERFNLTQSDAADLYDDSLVEAVREFQKAHGVRPTGNIGPQTVSVLNAGASAAAPDAGALIPELIANMERWRWMPRELGEHYVFVNVPEFALFVKRGYEVLHKARVIVGKPNTQTPIFSDLMDHMVVNPSWNVPQSIIRKEMMGKATASGGGYFNRGNYEVFVGSKKVDPTTVNWSSVSPGAVRVRQKPGAGNALGNIKFMFPNNHAVYIHDTSSRGLFSQDYRALSHGCVRVHEPFSFADALLSLEKDINGKALKSMVGGAERWVRMTHKVPVHIAYFTTFVDDEGKLQMRSDLYGHNGRVKKALGL